MAPETADVSTNATILGELSRDCPILLGQVPAQPASVDIRFIVNNAEVAIQVARDDDLWGLAERFVTDNDLRTGSHCSDDNPSCVTENIVLKFETELMLAELRTMEGRHFALGKLFLGQGYTRFLNNLFTHGILRHNPLLVPNATRVLRCARSALPAFAATSLTMANILHEHSPATDHPEGALGEARNLIQSTLSLSPGVGLGTESGFSVAPANDDHEIHELSVVTVGTSQRQELADLVRSVDLAGLGEMTVLGLGSVWEGLGSKMRWLQGHVASLAPESVVAFVDAYDVLALGAASQTLARFLRFQTPVVFSGEVNCAPDKSASLLYGDRDRPLPFLNSGSFVGRAGAITCMLQEVLEDIAMHHTLSPELTMADVDDQRWFTRYHLRHPNIAPIDNQGTIFHSLHAVDVGTLQVINSTSGQVRSALTNTEPCFIHGNAGGREELARVTAALKSPGSWLVDSADSTQRG